MAWFGDAARMDIRPTRMIFRGSNMMSDIVAWIPSSGVKLKEPSLLQRPVGIWIEGRMSER
jgi:hypothetical protein